MNQHIPGIISIGFSYTIGGVTHTFTADTSYTHRDSDGVLVRWDMTPHAAGLLIRLTLTLPQPGKIDMLCPVIARIQYPQDTRMYVKHGIDSRFVQLSDGLRETTQNAYLYRQGTGFFARSVYPLRFAEHFDVSCSDGLCTITQTVTPPDSFISDTFESPAVFIAYGDLSQALRDYNALLPQVDRGTPPIVGYNTWDYYFTDIDEECVQENLDFIKKTPFLRENLRYFTIDDGWQAIQGDWYANYRFPHGLPALAARIREAGFIPGIWSAPIHAYALSSYAQRRMVGYLENMYGDPLTEDAMYVLDPTHPAVREHVRELYTRLYDAGFRLFKVDYVTSLLRAKKFHDPNAGHYDALRTLFRDIRECVHDSVIIGCSLPVEAASPDADCGRTGIDIHTTWNHAKWAFENYQHHWGDHRRVWVSDIDFMVIRGQDTDRDPMRNVTDPNAHNPTRGRWRAGADFTIDEARSWAACVMLTGGNMNLSDRLTMLNAEGLAIIEKALTHRSDIAAEPLDQFMEDYPCVWRQGERLYVINWHDDARTFMLPCTRETKELWTDTLYAPTDGTLTLTLKPHESVILL